MPESNTPIGRGSPGIGAPEGLEIERDEAPVDGGQSLEVRDRDMLVGLVDRCGRESELDDRTIFLDEAGIGGPAVGRKRGGEKRDVVDGLAEQSIERAGGGR